MRSDLLERLRAGLPGAAELLRALAAEPGVWLVGGTVRDLLLERPPRPELDVAVEHDVDELTARLAAALGGVVRAHDRFGTATLALDGLRVDLARTRAERYPAPGALPVVRPAPLRDDLARRDFSVNAIALGLDGRIENVPGALDDVASAQLRVLHSASFRDDPTRLLRLVRYAVRLGFAIEPETARLAREAAAGGALDSVSSDRLAAELVLAAHEPDPVAVVALAADLGVLDGLAPGLVADGPLRGALALLGADGRRDALVLGALARELELAAAAAFVARFAADARARAAAHSVATEAKSLAAALEAAPERPSTWAELLRTSPVETVALAGALGPAERVRRWLEELRHVRLEIDGADVLAAGVAEGPAVGAGLAHALALRLDGQLAPGGAAEVEAALAAARRARP